MSAESNHPVGGGFPPLFYQVTASVMCTGWNDTMSDKTGPDNTVPGPAASGHTASIGAVSKSWVPGEKTSYSNPTQPPPSYDEVTTAGYNQPGFNNTGQWIPPASGQWPGGNENTPPIQTANSDYPQQPYYVVQPTDNSDSSSKGKWAGGCGATVAVIIIIVLILRFAVRLL